MAPTANTQVENLPVEETPGAHHAQADPPRPSSAFADSASFVAHFWPRLLTISALLIVPCFWHPHIEAGDLPSHTYNAWLAHLIVAGQAPGLTIARQSNNVLFDLMLAALSKIISLAAAEKLAVATSVLLFFWGAFALICAMAQPSQAEEASAAGTSPWSAPWFVLPALAIFAYGYTFEMGFLNYYISLGLAFFALALVVRGRGWERTLAITLTPIIWLAHPLGLVLLAGGGAYLLAASRLAPRRHIFLFVAAALIFFGVHSYIAGHYEVAWHSTTQVIPDGTDQLILYGWRYTLAANLLEIFLATCLITDVIQRPRGPQWWSPYLTTVELYGLATLAVALAPSAVRLPQYAAPLGLLAERLTSISAVLLLCLAARMRSRWWHFAGLAAIAAMFFAFLYQDTGKINNMETQVERYVRVIPPGQRIVATIWPFADSRVFMHHVVDRACVGQCFSYANYEPSSLQFRVRATQPNPWVMYDAGDADAVLSGEYIVQSRDLPLFEIYQCNLNMTTLCMRELAAGEANGAVGVHRSR
jgi:hypothetical protein